MKKKKPLIIVLAVVAILGAYVLNGNTFNNLWRNLTASLGGYSGIANPGDKVLSADSTYHYTKKFYDTTGAVYAEEKMEKEVPKGEEGTLTVVDGVAYTPEEFSVMQKSGSYVDQPKAEDVASADGIILVLKEEPALKARGKALAKGLSKDASDQAASVQKVKITTEHEKVKKEVTLKLGKELTTAHGKQAGKINIVEFKDTVNVIALKGVPIGETKKKLQGLADIQSFEPNVVAHADLPQSVPQIKADQVWPYVSSTGMSLTGVGMRVGVIDTGVDYTHPDLGGCFGVGCKVVGGYDFVNNDPDPMDDQGHGTHVSATVAGNGTFIPTGGTTSVPIIGVAPQASLYGYKVLDSSGSGPSTTIIQGIERCVDPNHDGNYADHLDVCTMSLGGLGNPDDSMSQAVDSAVANGVVFTVAAGNSGPGQNTVGSPGTSRSAITVAAACKPGDTGGSCSSGPIASFSSRGPVTWTDASGASQTIQKPDIAAPGVMICAAEWGTWHSERSCGSGHHIAISGTSMATPHMAGVAALLRQAHPEYTPLQIKNTLMQTASPFTGLTSSDQGTGLVDTLHALQVAGIPQSDLLFSGDLPLLINDPVTTTSQVIVKNINVKNLTAQTVVITPSLSGLSPGVSVSYNSSTPFSLAPNATHSLVVTFTINHAIAISNSSLIGNLTFTYGTHTVPLGFVVNVAGRISSPQTIYDLGLDPATQSSWNTTATIPLTNTLIDASTTYTVTSSCCGQGSSSTAAGITLTPPSSIVIPAGGTINLNAALSANNSSLPNGRYYGSLTLTSAFQTLKINLTFYKGYGLRLVYTSPPPSSVVVYQQGTSPIFVYPTAITTSNTVYVTTTGPWSVAANWGTAPSLGVFIGKGNISLGGTITDVPLSKAEAIYTVTYKPTLPNGSPLSSWSYLFFPMLANSNGWYIGGSIPLGSTGTADAYFKTNQTTDIDYRMVANAIYLNVPIVFEYQSNNFTQNTDVTNSSAGFKIKHLAGFPNNGSQNVQFSLVNLLEDWGTASAWKIQAPAATPVDLYVYSNGGAVSNTTSMFSIPSFLVDLYDQNNLLLAESDDYYVTQAQTYEYIPSYSLETSWNLHDASYQYFKIDPAPSDMINIGLNPIIPFTKTLNYVQMWDYLRSNYWGPSPYEQAGSNDFKEVPFVLKNNSGTPVVSGVWGTKENSLQPGLTYLSYVTENHTLELTKNVQVNTTPTTVKTTQKFLLPAFNGVPPSLDENPPEITDLHLVANGLWQQVIDPSLITNINFKVDPAPGIQSQPTNTTYVFMPDSLSNVSLAYHTNSNSNWVTIPTTGTSGSYSATLPVIAGTTLYTYQINATDLAGNTISHEFQIPQGTAMNPPVVTPFPTDTNPPVITIQNPLIGAVLSGNSYQFLASVTDNIGVSSVEFYLNGSLMSGMSMLSASQYSITINTTSYLNGPYTFMVKAYDSSNNLSTVSRNIIIDNGNFGTTCIHIPPTATILPASQTGAPGQGKDYTVTITDNNSNAYGTAGCNLNTFGVVTSAITLPGPGWTIIASPWAVAMHAGGSATQTLTLTPPLNASVGTYTPTNVYVKENLISQSSSALLFSYQVTAPSDVTPPSISNIITSNITTSSSVITWTTNEPSDTQVMYGTTPGSYPSTTAINPILSTSHSVTVASLASGTHYYFKVKSKDAASNLATSGENSFITVTVDTTPPTVSLTAPIPGATVSGITIVSATASDNVGVDHVDFLKNGAIIGADATAPYSIAWDTTTTGNGTYGMTAKAYDASGNFTSSSAITVIVNNVVLPPPDTTLPTVTLTAPATGQTLSGTTTLSANASDNIGVTHVDFYRGTTLIDTDTTGSPYAITWNTATVANGTYSITAKAYDAANNIATSSVVTITVFNDTTPPTVSITTPVTGTIISGTANITASATDNAGVTRVDFYRGTTLLGSDTTSPYSYSWNATTVTNGSYALTAKAYDAMNNVGISSVVSVTVNNVAAGDTTPPVVTITAPVSNTLPNNGNINVTAVASDVSGISGMNVSIDGVVKKTCASPATTCTYKWQMNGVSSGAHTITAFAYDNSTNHNLGTATPKVVTKP